MTHWGVRRQFNLAVQAYQSMTSRCESRLTGSPSWLGTRLSTLSKRTSPGDGPSQSRFRCRVQVCRAASTRRTFPPEDQRLSPSSLLSVLRLTHTLLLSRELVQKSRITPARTLTSHRPQPCRRRT